MISDLLPMLQLSAPAVPGWLRETQTIIIYYTSGAKLTGEVQMVTSAGIALKASSDSAGTRNLFVPWGAVNCVQEVA